jgi:tetratricopeptide (TPR) repeat protein
MSRIDWLDTAMRGFPFVALGSVVVLQLLFPVAARAQAGADAGTAHELNSSIAKGQQQPAISEAASTPWRSLSSEDGDDPTVGTPISRHDPPPKARKVAAKAERLAKKGRHEDAIKEYKAALKMDPQYYEAENNMALEQEAAEETKKAEKTLRHLMKSSPDHILAFTNLAALLCQEHRYREAEAVVRHGLKRHPRSFKANFLLGTILVDEGNWTPEARAKLEYAQTRYTEAKTLLEKWPPQATSN